MPIGTTAAIIAGAAITAGAGVASSNAQSKAAKSAANAQLQATNSTLELQKYVYDQQRADTAPWRDAGEKALSLLTEGYKAGVFDPSNFTFEADPGYQFRLAEGENALNRAAAARGNRLSGAQLKAATRFGQDYASNEFANAWNRNATARTTNFNQLAATANVGQTAVSQVNQAGQNYANASGNALMAGGNASANAFLAGGAAQAGMYGTIAGAANQGIQNALLYKMMGA